MIFFSVIRYLFSFFCFQFNDRFLRSHAGKPAVGNSAASLSLQALPTVPATLKNPSNTSPDFNIVEKKKNQLPFFLNNFCRIGRIGAVHYKIP